MPKLTLSDSQLATVIAALSWWQGRTAATLIPNRLLLLFESTAPLDPDELTALIEQLDAKRRLG